MLYCRPLRARSTSCVERWPARGSSSGRLLAAQTAPEPIDSTRDQMVGGISEIPISRLVQLGSGISVFGDERREGARGNAWRPNVWHNAVVTAPQLGGYVTAHVTAVPVVEQPMRVVGVAAEVRLGVGGIAARCDRGPHVLRAEGLRLRVREVRLQVKDAVAVSVACDNDEVRDLLFADEVQDRVAVGLVAVPRVAAADVVLALKRGVAVHPRELELLREDVPARGCRAESVEKPLLLLVAHDRAVGVKRGSAIAVDQRLAGASRLVVAILTCVQHVIFDQVAEGEAA